MKCMTRICKGSTIIDLGGGIKTKNPVDISGTAVGESSDFLLLSGTVVGENLDHVCWECDASSLGEKNSWPFPGQKKNLFY